MNLRDLALSARFLARHVQSVFTGLYVPLNPDGANVVDVLPCDHVDRNEMFGGTSIPVGIGDGYLIPGFGWLRIVAVSYVNPGTRHESIVRAWDVEPGQRLLRTIISADGWTRLGEDRAELRLYNPRQWDVHPHELHLRIRSPEPSLTARDASLGWTLIGFRIEHEGRVVGHLKQMAIPCYDFDDGRALSSKIVRGIVVPPRCTLVAVFGLERDAPRAAQLIEVTGIVHGVFVERSPTDRLRLTETPENAP